DPRVREVLGFGKPGEGGVAVEGKLVTVVHGNDLANVSFLNFQAMQEDTAKVWTEELFKLATNILSQNASRNTFLLKAYTKLKLQVNQDGKIPVKNILKMFSDKKRVETALEQCGLVTNRGKPFLSLDQLTDFINRRQRDSRLNEVLYPPLKREQIRQLMEKYESNASQLERDQISLMGFIGQLTGLSSVEMAKQQAKMAEYCRTIFGDALLIDPLEKYPLIPAQPLPSPQELLGKILIKNKKKHHHRADSEGGQLLSNGEEKLAESLVKDGDPRKSIGGEGESDEEEEDEPVAELKKPNSDEFVEYNKKQLSRIYPKGTRVDSSNYMPQLFWNVGCQMVALNFQTLDLPMQLNMGVFEYNGHSGYLLKPEFMRRTDKHFDPFTENIVDGIVANTVKIRVISGQFLTDKKVGVYVEVDIFGLPADTKRKYRTRTSNGNSLDPVWDDETFVFNKVVLPTLASLRIAVFEENGKFLGHRICPVSTIRPGYHYISLKNEMNQPLLLPSLLVYTEAQDYIPNEHQEYAEALTNPIKHVSLLDQRERQLAALMEDNGERVLEQPKEGERDRKGDAPLGKIPSPLHPVPAPIDDISDLISSPGPGQKEDLIATVWTLSKEQRSRCNQLCSDTQRRRSQMEKHLKRSMKKNEPAEPVQRQLTALEMELQKQTVQLREWQMQELLKLRQQQHTLEREKKHTHLRELDEAQSRRQEKLVIGQREVLRHIEEEQPLLQARLERDLEAELQRLPEEICQYLQVQLESKGLRSDALFSSLSNHSPSSSSGPPSNCSTPTFPLTPNRSTWNRSLDNSIASLVDSSSSSTPVLSEADICSGMKETFFLSLTPSSPHQSSLTGTCCLSVLRKGVTLPWLPVVAVGIAAVCQLGSCCQAVVKGKLTDTSFDLKDKICLVK
ncbi:unnamed protein product, partial [Coregonus sp. 'balchen']